MIYAQINIEKLFSIRFSFDAVYHGVKTSGYFRRILRIHGRQAKQSSRTITFQCFCDDGSSMIAKCYVDGSIRMNVGQPNEIFIPNYINDLLSH